MFSNQFLLFTGLKCLIPIVLVIVVPLLVRFVQSALSEKPPTWRIRRQVVTLLKVIFVSVCWGIIGLDLYGRNLEIHSMRQMEAGDVVKVVYFENYKASEPKLVEEIVQAINEVQPIDVPDHKQGVPLEIHLHGGKVLKWRAGQRGHTESFWIETERHQLLGSPELDKAFHKAHFPI